MVDYNYNMLNHSWNDFRGEREKSLRQRAKSLRERCDKGEWMQESPLDFECMIAEIDRLRSGLRKLYVYAIQSEVPLAFDIQDLLNEDSVELIKNLNT